MKLDVNDAALIPQPDYVDLWNAYVAGAKSARSRPHATEFQINRAADAWCKLVHSTKDPIAFQAMGNTTTSQ